MIEVHYIRHNIREGIFQGLMYYYMDMSETQLYNHFVDKYGTDKIIWKDNRLVLKCSDDIEIILEIRTIKPISFVELINVKVDKYVE